MNASKDSMNFGTFEHRRIYNSEQFEVVGQTAWRGGICRICVCDREDNAESISKALNKYARHERNKN